MFTGLITDQTRVFSSQKVEGGYSVLIGRPSRWMDLVRGESIALNGICLTVEDFDAIQIQFFVGLETLAKTNFQFWKKGDEINLERSLRMGDRLGGHLVSGHVDGVALVEEARLEGALSSLFLRLRVAHALGAWIVDKGSICVNGVSLTVNKWASVDDTVELLLIPETLRVTNLKNVKRGDFVNIECDQMVKIIVEKFNKMENIFPKIEINKGLMA